MKKPKLPQRHDLTTLRISTAAALLALALTACSADEKPAEESAAEREAPEFPAADGGPQTGRFEISSPTRDVVIVQEVRKDGTYSSSLDGQVTETGTWAAPSRGLFCTESNGNKSCDEESIAPDGTWQSVNVEDAGNRWIVRRLPDAQSE